MNYDLPDFKVKYLEMKKKLYSQFFKYMTVLFFTPLLLESSRAYIDLKASILVALIIGIIGTAFLFKIICGLNNQYQEIAMTIFCFLSCVFITAVNYADPKGYFLDPLNSFYFGYGICSFERLILSKIPNMKHRNIFRIAIVITCLFIITPNQLSLYLMQGVHSLSGIYFDFEAERRDKSLFKSYFNYKNQLMKFKDLVVRDIPDSIAVVTQDLKDCLFLNNSFSELFKISSTSDVCQKLHEFTLQDHLPKLRTKDLHDKVLFLTFMERAIEKWNMNPHSQEKFSCNIIYSSGLIDYSSLSDMNSKDITRIFEARIFPIMWDGNPAVAITLHDITEQQTILSLKLADAQKDALLATVSHELRTPLNGMLGMIQIMRKRIQDPELLHYLDIFKNSSNLLLALVNSILDLNQVRAKTIKLYSEKICIKALLNDIVQLFKIQCAQKEITLQFEIAKDILDTHIFTDKNRLTQILINLVGNALKFTQKGGIKILALNPNNSTKKGNFIEFKVIDTGIGIKEEDRYKLFRMFGKLEQTNTRVNHEGVGLGLTISDSLVKLLSGNNSTLESAGIQLESVYGKGSTFSFLIKKNLSLSQSNVLGDRTFQSSTSFGELGNIEAKVLSHSSLSFKNFKSISSPSRETTPSLFRNLQPLQSPYILIVDDNPLNLIVAEHFVTSQGHRVKTALSGQAAIDLILNNDHLKEPVSLVLMDLQMPTMDGYQATRYLKRLMQDKDVPEIPVVALTANNSEADKQACIEAGMSTYLCKPLKEDELKAVLNKFIN